MARKRRIWYPGATYHITARGNRRAHLFYHDKDRLDYLSLLEKTRQAFPFTLHAYCLMTNHVHFLLETKEVPINRIMHAFHSSYAMLLNRRYDLTGHVFQGRYGAEIINSTDYFLKVSRYIHLNPLEAQMVQRAEDYYWSSYAAYITRVPNPHISTDKVLSYFPSPQKMHYRKFVESKNLSLSE